MKKFGIAVLALVAIIVLDFTLSEIADRKVRAANYYFEEKTAVTELDFEGERLQGCDFGVVFRVYLFRTCFVLNNSFEDRSRWFFGFTYASPSPVLFGGSNRESYHFKEISIAPTYKVIFENGEVKVIQ